MRVVRTATGLQLVESAPAPCGPADLRIAMVAAPIHPLDHQDAPPGTSPGVAGVGRVVDGPRWTGRHVVLPLGHGTWTTETCAPADACLLLDDDADPMAAALARIDGVAAQALLAGLERGATVILNAGTGGLAANLIRLARRMGVRTIAVVRAPAETGADVTLVDDPTLADRVRDALEASPLHRGIDAVGGDSTARLGACLADGGRVVHVGAVSGAGPRLHSDDAVERGILLQGFSLARSERLRGLDETRHVLHRLLELGMHDAAESTWRLEDAADAVAHARRARGGRVVFAPAERRN
jgi:NADPH:quinone reductase-like Zn-dependent oxidoreductase